MMDRFIDEDLKYTETERQHFVIEDGSGLCPDNHVTADVTGGLGLACDSLHGTAANFTDTNTRASRTARFTA